MGPQRFWMAANGPHRLRVDTTVGRFRASVFAQIIYFVVKIASGLWYTPFLIKHLGMAAYGLVPLSNQITNYMSVVTVALTGSIGRFLTIDLVRGDRDASNRTFNTAFFASLALTLLLTVPGVALSIIGSLLLKVPPGQEVQVRYLLLGSTAYFLINYLANPFLVSSFVSNRLDIRTWINMLGLIVQMAAIIAFFSYLSPMLWQVGVAFVIAGAVTLGCSVWSWRTLTPELRINPRHFDRNRIGDLLSMGGWLTLNRLGSFLFAGTDLLLVNLLVGAKAGGQYGAVQQWALMLRAMALVVSSVLMPTIMVRFAQEDHGSIVRISSQAVKLIGLALALPIGLIAGLSRPLLTVWLGREYADLSSLMMILTLPALISMATNPLLGIQQAANRVKWPAMATLGSGIVNVGLDLLLAGPVGWGMYGIAWASALVAVARDGFFTLVYAGHVAGRSPRVFVGPLVPALLGLLLLTGAAHGIANAVDLASWPRLIVVGTALGVSYTALAYFVGLRGDERAALHRLVLPERPVERNA